MYGGAINRFSTFKMALKKGSGKGSQLLAKLVTENKAPCAFCRREVDDEIIYGKLYAIGDIQCHYFCVLLSCCLVQKGRDEDGLFGFLYPDILAEVERSKKHKCSYCSREGATLGCSVSQCRKQFHLPCGREKNAVSLFYGNYKTFCQSHAPKQSLPESILSKVRLRKKMLRNRQIHPELNTSLELTNDTAQPGEELEPVCVICYEPVDAFPAPRSFWPPCCARDAWFHRTCLQRMALSAGMHYLKCPLCNDKEEFYEAVVSQGFYVPDRDAAWELEQNAFAEIYERPVGCGAERCLCPRGRGFDADTGEWDIQLCLLCGSSGAHAHCVRTQTKFVCVTCEPAAKGDLEALAEQINNVMLQEQLTATVPRPVMPSRMSLRRTKRGTHRAAGSSPRVVNETILQTHSQDRQNSNPKSFPSPTKSCLLSVPSPLKEAVLKELAERRKPCPLPYKRKIVDQILSELLHKPLQEAKSKDPIKEWTSPKKCCEAVQEQTTIESSQSVPDIFLENSNSESQTYTEQQDLFSQTYSEDQETAEKKNSGDETDGKLSSPTYTENQTAIDDENDSNSTFQLSPEFVANSDEDSLPIFDTPKKLKTVDMQKDSSLEISANDEVINIDMLKMESNDKDFSLLSPSKVKLSPKVDKNADIDVESFKNYYLNEVDKCKCVFNHNHSEIKVESTIRTAIDFARDAALKKESDEKITIVETGDSDNVPKDTIINVSDTEDIKPIDIVKKNKKNKKNKSNGEGISRKADIARKKKERKLKLVKKSRKKNKERKANIDFTVNKKDKKIKTKLSIRDKHIQVKIKWKEEKLNLEITKSNNRKRKASEHSDNLKQYVFQYSPSSSKDFIVKPEFEVSPLKRKYIKLERSPDHLVQTSIQKFFQVKPNRI